jgi:hypothetical protein
VVSHQQEVFHSIGCGDYSNTLRATRVVVALSSRNVKAMALRQEWWLDLRGGEFPQDLGRRMTKSNQ